MNDIIKNKKVIYGAIGAVALIIIFMIFSSGSDSKLSPNLTKALTMGQTYTLDNPNHGGVLLVKVPGKFGSREDESKDSDNVCVVDGGTAAVVEEETVINYMHFVKVKPQQGDCSGKSGWTSKINVK